MSATLTTLGSFNGTDGMEPEGSLIADAAGDLFGTTEYGGDSNAGTVFEIANTATGYSTAPTTLVSFNFTDGYAPTGGLLIDAAGDLFGITDAVRGFPYVFEIANTATGYSGAPTVIASFGGTSPYSIDVGNLVADAEGDLFGIAQGGGDGVVFEILKGASGYSSTPTVIATLDRAYYGGDLSSDLMIDASGDLFGTTDFGGASGDGAVFEIANTIGGYSGTPTMLASFGGPVNGTFINSTGEVPVGSLITDAAGDLFGCTLYGGTSGYGTVFEIAKTASGYSTTPTVLASFNGADGQAPQTGLIADAAGDLFGTTYEGGASGYGTVFEIAKTASGYSGTPTVLVSFNGTNYATGAYPHGSLIANAAGDLFGTTSADGTSQAGAGTVFEVTDSGFVVDPIAIGGTQAGQSTTEQSPIDPFANVTITDANAGQTETITVAPSTTIDGTLSDPNAATDGSSGNDGTLIFSGTATQVQSDLNGLIFTPIVGQYGTIGFTITVQDTLGQTATDSTTSVAVTPPTNLIEDGSFETPVAGPGGVNTGFLAFSVGDTFGGWTVVGSTQGNVAISPDQETSLVGGTTIQLPAADGSQFLDLTGTTDNGAVTGIEQGFATQAGDTYTLSFAVSNVDYANYPGTSTTVSVLLNGQQLFSPTNNEVTGPELQWESFSTNFVATSAYTTLEFLNQGTGDVHGIDDVVVEPACYCPATRIATDRGEIAIENLAIGDLVLTLEGKFRPIRWIGHRAYAPPFARGNKAIWPVRIAAGALCENRPRRDLLVSPNHALFIDGVLIEAACLVNGASIIVTPPDGTLEYFNIELDSPEIVLAEGVPAETFLDRDCRDMFQNAHEYRSLYPDADADPAPVFYARRVIDGAALAAVKARIDALAGLSDATLAHSSWLHGWLDRADHHGVAGWAIDCDHPGAPVALEIQVDGVAVARLVANRFRADLTNVGNGSGRCSFDMPWESPLEGSVTHIITVRRATDSVPLPGGPAILLAPESCAAIQPLLAQAVEDLLARGNPAARDEALAMVMGGIDALLTVEADTRGDREARTSRFRLEADVEHLAVA